MQKLIHRAMLIAAVLSPVILADAVHAVDTPEACFMQAGQDAADEGYAPGTSAWKQEAIANAVQNCNLSSAGGSNYTNHQLEAFFDKVCATPDKCYVSY